jgi:hypothetical protein
VVPVLGLVVTELVLQEFGKSEGTTGRPVKAWRLFPKGAIRADISGDVVECAGQEERFPWRLAPIRTLAILAIGAARPGGLLQFAFQFFD